MTLCRRNVANNMLLTHGYMLLTLQLAATCLLCATFTIATPTQHTQTTIANNNAPSSAKARSTAATPTNPVVAGASAGAVPVTEDGEVIGATSLAAAAGAAAAMSTDLSMPVHSDAGTDSQSSGSSNKNNHSNKSNPSSTSTVNNSNNSNNKNQQNEYRGSNDALIATSANLLLEDMQPTAGHIVNLTRHHDGDVFRTNGVTNCNSDTCVGLSSGTATLLRLMATSNAGSGNDNSQHVSAVGSVAGGSNSQLELLSKRTKALGGVGDGTVGESCECRCLPYLSTYRDDLGICVDDIHECTLSPFVSGSSSEKIPFVFLPLRGQIIYPSREISFPDIRTPVCAVTGAQYMTTNGWSDLRNPIDTDYPFRMFRDEGRTFLQWLGEPDLRHKMQGRLIVVHLVCRDMTLMLNASAKDHVMPPKNVFSPCVAFRVNGSPVKYFHNVSEVLFQSENTSTLASTSDGMTTKEYVVIGVCSLLLGLIYVSSVFLYLHMKKRKNGRDQQQRNMRNSLDDLANDINYPKNDQVTFGAPFNRSGSIYSATSLATSNEPRSRASIGSLKEDLGIVKNNPLLQHFPQLGEHHSGFASDISNSNSECEMDGTGGGYGGVSGAGGSFRDKLKQLQTAALVHPQMNSVGGNGSGSSGSPNGNQTHAGHGNCIDEESIEPSTSPTQENECLPVENVSIVEDMMTEEKLENLRAMVNGNVRKKLYFNPAYFEPHLLAQPPPAAVEFLHKIREVIAIAKYKMATKRYQPSLIMIPEESQLRSSTPSLYDSQVHTSSTTECQGCANNRCSGHVKNCGDKRNSIEKWLQSVQTRDNEQQRSANEQNGDSETRQQSPQNHNNSHVKHANQQHQKQQHQKQQHRNESLSTQIPNNRYSPRREITPPKQRPPPPPTPTKNLNEFRKSQKSNIIAITQGDYRQTQETNTYQSYRAKVNTGSSVSIPIGRNYDVFSALSAAANMYGFAETGTEIYNNPKFTLHDSPSASQRSHGSSNRSKNSRKRLEALDQYAAAITPNSLTSADRQHYDMLRSMDQETSSKALRDSNYNATLLSNGSFHLDIPTPDYDSTIEKKFKEIYNTAHSSAPSVPTPDYSTLSRKSLKQGQQPDSPIYRRKSPQYLIVDYETDSLERLEVTKRKSSQSSSPSSDVSSQLSPSLSTALPLEEELEITHTVYNNKIEGFRKDHEIKKKMIVKSTSSTHKEKDLNARIKYDTPFRGSMTIEVEHEPPSDMERSTDSDQFEPDTLERKFKKQSFCDVSAWSIQQQHQQKASQVYTTTANANSMSSLPDMNRHQSDVHKSPFMLRASSSFRGQSAINSDSIYESQVELRTQQTFKINNPPSTEFEERQENEERRPSFNSLREMYQSPLVRQNSQQSCKCGGQARLQMQQSLEELTDQGGRLLTLEAKHTRRQRLIESPTPPSVVEIKNVTNNKTTIKISTPKVDRVSSLSNHDKNDYHLESAVADVEPLVDNSNSANASPVSKRQKVHSPIVTKHIGDRIYYDVSKPVIENGNNAPIKPPKLFNTPSRSPSKTPILQPRHSTRASPPPPPAPPCTSASTTLNSHKSHASSKHSVTNTPTSQRHYQNQNQYMHRSATATEEDTMSNHSQSTEFTGVSDTIANGSEFGGSLNNTLSSVVQKAQAFEKCNIGLEGNELSENLDGSRCSSMRSKVHTLKQLESPQMIKKLEHNQDKDYGAMFNTQINGLRNDYSLTKYMNRRKTHNSEDDQDNCNDADMAQIEDHSHSVDNSTHNNNLKNVQNAQTVQNAEQEHSISSRSNRSSSGRLSDRTKEMYRNAGVPVGIAYPQRSTASGVAANAVITNTPPAAATNAVQTVYRCEIEPVQLTHGMQIAMGLKDRAKKAKDLKNAWRKFVSMATSKFSPIQSPSPSYDKKTPSFLEVLDRDEGISSLIDDHPQVSTPQSSYSAPASHNYYEQRFGTRTQEMDSGYMSADSGEVYKRSFYDRYNFKMRSGRDQIIRVDTIEDNSDAAESTGHVIPTHRNNVVDSNRFEDFEHIGEPPPHELVPEDLDNSSDTDSDKTLTRSSNGRIVRDINRRTSGLSSYSSEDERGQDASYGSSETDGETTNAEEMWESGAESIETHSVLYKNVRQH